MYSVLNAGMTLPSYNRWLCSKHFFSFPKPKGCILGCAVRCTVSPTPPLQFIQFGTASGVYSQTIAASQFVTYTPASLCGQFTAVNSFINPGLFVTATITVAPNTKIYYRVGTLVCQSLHCMKWHGVLTLPE